MRDGAFNFSSTRASIFRLQVCDYGYIVQDGSALSRNVMVVADDLVDDRRPVPDAETLYCVRTQHHKSLAGAERL